MDPQPKKPSPARAWWMLFGAMVVFLVGTTVLDGLLRDEPAAPAPDREQRGSVSAGVPQVHRLEDGAVEIRHDFFRRTTIRLDDDESGAALYECLEKGFEEAFGDGIDGWTRGRVRDETRRVQDRCLGLYGVSPPTPPAPPRRD
jgi:hypothetical protein